MENIILLVVDVQTALVETQPFNVALVINNIKQLIKTARQNNIEIIYIRHDGGAGDDLEKGTEGWDIYRDIASQPHDKVFDKKYNSAFKETGLREYLDSKGVTTIILVGMQTEYCIDATCKAAFEYGYHLIIPQDTTTTFDNDLFSGELLAKYYESKIWNQRFAKVILVSEVIKMIAGNGDV